jgi:hypothetical protein
MRCTDIKRGFFCIIFIYQQHLLFCGTGIGLDARFTCGFVPFFQSENKLVIKVFISADLKSPATAIAEPSGK